MSKLNPESAWATHIAKARSLDNAGPYNPRPGDWVCLHCKPKTWNFSYKNDCFKCGKPKPLPGELPPKETSFGVRGDSLLVTRHDAAATKKKRTFKAEFEHQFWETFGNSEVDYDINGGETIRAVTTKIVSGPTFDSLCVGIGIQDLMDSWHWSEVVSFYPPTLDQELQLLAGAIRMKAPLSVVWVGGPAEFWGRPDRWNNFMARARNTLRKGGVQVVPAETVDFVMRQMTLSNDTMHIANNDQEKTTFVAAWATCLAAAGQDPTWGLALTDEPAHDGSRIVLGQGPAMPAIVGQGPSMPAVAAQVPCVPAASAARSDAPLTFHSVMASWDSSRSVDGRPRSRSPVQKRPYPEANTAKLTAPALLIAMQSDLGQ